MIKIKGRGKQGETACQAEEVLALKACRGYSKLYMEDSSVLTLINSNEPHFESKCHAPSLYPYLSQREVDVLQGVSSGGRKVL